MIDEIEKQLSLGRAAVEPSRASLFRFGNVSSSSIWWACLGGQGGARQACPTKPACRTQRRRPLAMAPSPPVVFNVGPRGGLPLVAEAPLVARAASRRPPLPPSHPRYVLAYTETYRGVRKGDRVWQLGFGSGFKCNSAVWVANRTQRTAHPAWERFDVDHMVRAAGRRLRGARVLVRACVCVSAAVRMGCVESRAQRPTRAPPSRLCPPPPAVL